MRSFSENWEFGQGNTGQNSGGKNSSTPKTTDSGESSGSEEKKEKKDNPYFTGGANCSLCF